MEYISPSGFNYTEFIITDEDKKDFEKLCEVEPKCNRPLSECFRDVAEAINLHRKIICGNKGLPYGKAMVQLNPELN